MSALDVQVGGSHYRTMEVQPVEFILANRMGFCEGSVIKYVCRWRSKNGAQDLEKARHYLQIIQGDKDYRLRFADHKLRYSKAGMSPAVFCRKNGIKNPEAGVVNHLWHWNNSGASYELDSAMAWLDEAIEAVAA